MEFAEVKIETAVGHEKQVFLGTSKSCGLFSAETRVQDSSGRAHRVQSVVDGMVISDLRFEEILTSDAKAQSFLVVSDEVWLALAYEAAFLNETALAIRCKRPDPTALFGDLRIGRACKRGDRYYFIIERRELGDRLSAKKLLDIVTFCFLDDEERYEFARGNAYLAMETARGLARENKYYAFSYDSLQHTSLIHVRASDGAGSVLSRGGCAHVVASDEVAEMRLSWESTSWTPTINGVLISAARE